jgi:HEAT repeat protein
MNDFIKWTAACLAVFAIGCAAPPPSGAKREKALKELPPAPKPPEYAAAKAVPLDNDLREQARQQILTSFRSSSTVMRCQAVEAAQLGLGAEATGLIMGALGDAKPLVRFAGAMAAGTLRLETARSTLINLAEDNDANVRVAVRYALHRLGDTSRSRDLEQYSISNDPVVRRNTVMALGLLGEKTAVRVLWPMQKDVDSSVRLAVAEAMWRLGEDEGLKSCVAACVSQYPDDQIIGTLALAGPRDKRIRPYLRGKLTTPYDEVNLAAARALGMIGEDLGYGVAMKGARADDPRQRALAALAFGEIGRSDAQPVLAGLLKDNEEPVRIAAALGVLQLKETQGQTISAR